MSHESNGNTPQLPRIAPSAPPLWFMKPGTADVSADDALRAARLEGLQRLLGEESES